MKKFGKDAHNNLNKEEIEGGRVAETFVQWMMGEM